MTVNLRQCQIRNPIRFFAVPRVTEVMYLESVCRDGAGLLFRFMEFWLQTEKGLWDISYNVTILHSMKCIL